MCCWVFLEAMTLLLVQILDNIDFVDCNGIDCFVGRPKVLNRSWHKTRFFSRDIRTIQEPTLVSDASTRCEFRVPWSFVDPFEVSVRRQSRNTRFFSQNQTTKWHWFRRSQFGMNYNEVEVDFHDWFSVNYNTVKEHNFVSKMKLNYI